MESKMFDPELFLRDLRVGSSAIGAPHDPSTNRRILEAFERESKEGVIQFRIGSPRGSAVNYRIGCLPKVDWLARLREADMVPETAPMSLVDLLPELRGRHPSAYLGADFDAAIGFQKVYLMFDRPIALSDLLRVDGVPEVLRAQEGQLSRSGLSEVTIVAVDYRKASVNVYFVWRDPTTAWLSRFAEAWGHGPVSEEVAREILAATPVHGSVATTWSARSPVPKRWCVYAIGLRYDDPTAYEPGGPLAGYRLPPLHERFRRFDENTGSQTDAVAYGLGWSFGEPFTYLKYERSYTGDLARYYEAQTDSYAKD